MLRAASSVVNRPKASSDKVAPGPSSRPWHRPQTSPGRQRTLFTDQRSSPRVSAPTSLIRDSTVPSTYERESGAIQPHTQPRRGLRLHTTNSVVAQPGSCPGAHHHAASSFQTSYFWPSNRRQRPRFDFGGDVLPASTGSAGVGLRAAIGTPNTRARMLSKSLVRQALKRSIIPTTGMVSDSTNSRRV
jgi:hypothetical protein